MVRYIVIIILGLFLAGCVGAKYPVTGPKINIGHKVSSPPGYVEFKNRGQK